MNATESILITPEVLAGRLTDPAWRVIDCRFNVMLPDAGPAAYQAGHLPGAFYADLDQDLASPPVSGSGRHPLPDANTLSTLFGEWGVTSDVQVVVYDDAGGAIAARLWWLLRWMGHTRVSMLDGGLPAWQALDLPMSTQPAVRHDMRFEGSPGAMAILTTREIEMASGSDDLLLLDARAEDRFAGRVEPIDREAGHVPGAINTPFQMNLTAEGRFRPANELCDLYQTIIAEHSAVPVGCMCGSGVTACHTLFAMELAGITDVRLYVGSWSEWINQDSAAIATGDGNTR